MLIGSLTNAFAMNDFGLPPLLRQSPCLIGKIKEALDITSLLTHRQQPTGQVCCSSCRRMSLTQQHERWREVVEDSCKERCGCGSKPMVPFWGRCTTHFNPFWWGLGCSLGVLAFDPWPCRSITCQTRLMDTFFVCLCVANLQINFRRNAEKGSRWELIICRVAHWVPAETSALFETLGRK